MVNLDFMSSRAVVLSHRPRRILTLQVGQGEPSDPELHAVMVDHNEPYGLLTVLPNPLADTADSTFAMRGFLIEGLFDDRLED